MNPLPTLPLIIGLVFGWLARILVKRFVRTFGTRISLLPVVMIVGLYLLITIAGRDPSPACVIAFLSDVTMLIYGLAPFSVGVLISYCWRLR